MELTRQYRAIVRRAPAARITAATVAVFCLFALVFAPDTARAASSHATKSIVISTTKNSTLGTILVSRTTLYTLKPSGTACAAKCLKLWPEVLLPKGVTKATAGSGISAAKLGTVKRVGGALQVTYAGEPLYWFSKDTAAGQVNGNVTDTWGKWSVVVTKKASTGGGATTTTTSPGGGGVGF
jgi:predicted lipoprotein with Yx(FWY)xxD motif